MQRQFDTAQAQVKLGRYGEAIEIFTRLEAQTGAKRISLELAKALYLDRQYKQSRQVFERVLAAPDLPPQVRLNIRSYLQLIRANRFDISYRLGLIRDDNPVGSSSAQEITVFGIPFRYEATTPPTKAWGVRIEADMKWPTRYARFENKIRLIKFDEIDEKRAYWTGVMSVPLAWDKMQMAFGYSLFERNDKEISRKPFVELRTDWPATNRRYSVNLSVGETEYRDYDYLSGNFWKLGFGQKTKRGNVLFNHGVSYLTHNAASNADSYEATTIEAGASFFVKPLNSAILLSLGRMVRDHRGADPMFMVSREDRQSVLELHVTSYKKLPFSALPRLTFSHLRVHSTIPLYSSEKSSVELTFSF